MSKVVKAYVLEPAQVNVATMQSDATPLGVATTPAGPTLYMLEHHGTDAGMRIMVERRFLVVPSDRAIPPAWDVRYVGTVVADGVDPVHVFEIIRGFIEL